MLQEFYVLPFELRRYGAIFGAPRTQTWRMHEAASSPKALRCALEYCLKVWRCRNSQPSSRVELHCQIGAHLRRYRAAPCCEHMGVVESCRPLGGLGHGTYVLSGVVVWGQRNGKKIPGSYNLVCTLAHYLQVKEATVLTTKVRHT